MSKTNLSRRAFLAAATTTATVTLATPRLSRAQVVPGKKSPNETLNVAGIGVGGKGLGDIMACKGKNIVALADVDWNRAGEAFYKMPKAKRYYDYRKMLDEMGKEIDACTISTPDHTHAPAAYMAMKMGIHVYVQKPLTHTIAEARLLTKTAREMKVVTQMGNQGHCGHGVRELCEMMWDGAIGQVKEAHVWTNRPIWPQGIKEPLALEAVPDTMDWDLWIGSAPMRDYNQGYAPFAWRGWWDFGCGAIGDMACHIMDPAFFALKLYEAKTFSVEVVQQEEMSAQCALNKSVIKYQFPARGDMPPVDVYWYDGGILPKRPEGVPADQVLGEGDNGSFFVGTDGVITSGCYGDDSRLMPDEKMKDYKRPEKSLKRVIGGNPYMDWLISIKRGQQAQSNFDYAGPLTETANLGNVALHAGKKIVYDVEKMSISNDTSLNHLLTKEYRKGWELPC